MIDIKNLLLGLVLAVAVAGCSDDTQDIDSGTTDSDTDSDTDTDTDTACPQGEYSGHFEINTQSDVAILAGYTFISGDLIIECPGCIDLSELICLTSVGEALVIRDNAALTNLDGLNGITSVGGFLDIFSNDVLTDLDGLNGITSVCYYIWISSNNVLPDCEVCDLLDQLPTAPTIITVENNLDDSCTPVPDNCP
jgi:hypothetical protein